VRLDQTINASVSVNLIGGDVAPGVKEGGVLSQVLREVTVEALPLEVPEHIDFDVSTMEIGGTLRLAELTAPEGVTILGEMESVVATITAPTREEVVEPTEEELAAAEAAGEGEAAEGEGGEEAPADAETEASGDEAPAEE